MDTVFDDMIDIAINSTTNADMKRGLELARDLYDSSGYYNIEDWYELTEEEKREEVMGYNKDTFTNEDSILEPLEFSTQIKATTLEDLKLAVESRIDELEGELSYL